MFRTVPLPFIIRSFSLYTQQWYMSYRFADSLRAGRPSWLEDCWLHASLFTTETQVCHRNSLSVLYSATNLIFVFPLMLHFHLSYRFADSLRAESGRTSCSQAVSKPVWRISLLCVQWQTPDDGQRNCPKHVEFYSKNKFEEISASSWFYYKNLSWCTATWMPKSLIYLH